MKKILFILLLLSMISCQKKQEKYVISGQLNNIPDETIIDLYIEYDELSSRIKSDTIFDGHFEFSDTLSERPTKMNLMIRDREKFWGSCEIWVDYNNILIKGENNYLSSWIVESEVPEQKSLNKLNHKTKHIAGQLDSLALLRSKNRENREFIKLIRSQMDSINQIIQLTEIKLIEQNPNSFSAVKKLYYLLKSNKNIPKDKVDSIYKNLDPIYKKTLYAEGISAILNKPTPPKVGDKIFDFEAFDITGKTFKLSDFNGKVILLDFWTTYCFPCIESIPELKELNDKYQKDLTIIGFNLDTKKELWEEGLKRDNVPWLNLSDGKGTFTGVGVKYGIFAYPTYFFISREGIILGRFEGFNKNKFDDILSNLIKDIEE